VPDYKLPDVGEGLTEAEIVTWKVRVGDVVAINDVVVEIETAKSLVELPSPYAGTVQALHVPEGETVAVGTPIISIGDPAELPSAATPGAPPEIDMSNPAATGGGENQTLVGYGPRVASAERRVRRAAPATAAGAAAQLQVQGAFGQGGPAVDLDVDLDEVADIAEAATTTTTTTTAAAPAPAAAAPAPAVAAPHAEVRMLAKPPVRKLAKDLGVDLRSLAPSGPAGTVTREDVVSAAELSEARSALAASPSDTSGQGGGGDRREPIKGVRKRMAEAMVASAFTAPHVTEWVTVDVTRTTRLLERLRAHRDFRDVPVSPLLLVAKAVCLAVARTPEINATWDEAAGEVVFKSSVNLGIAAATPRGLVVPNVKGADRLPLPVLAAALRDLTRTAREGRTQPAEMSGGTFTITNVGVFGVDAGTPIINPGESAILCFGASKRQPWVVGSGADERLEIRDVCTLALSFDHRHVDGEKGSRYLADVAAIMEDPAAALLF
jgi:2-oxoisovalerate dehydrogenase E2 component (dihydrolipoyl transacylase)